MYPIPKQAIPFANRAGKDSSPHNEHGVYARPHAEFKPAPNQHTIARDGCFRTNSFLPDPEYLGQVKNTPIYLLG